MIGHALRGEVRFRCSVPEQELESAISEVLGSGAFCLPTAPFVADKCL